MRLILLWKCSENAPKSRNGQKCTTCDHDIKKKDPKTFSYKTQFRPTGNSRNWSLSLRSWRCRQSRLRFCYVCNRPVACSSLWTCMQTKRVVLCREDLNKLVQICLWCQAVTCHVTRNVVKTFNYCIYVRYACASVCVRALVGEVGDMFTHLRTEV